MRGHLIEHMIVGDDFGDDSIQTGSGRRPELGRIDFEFKFSTAGPERPEASLCFGSLQNFTVWREQASAHADVRFAVGIIEFNRGNYGRFLFRNVRRGDVESPQWNVNWINSRKPHMAVDSGSRIPTAILPFVADANR